MSFKDRLLSLRNKKGLSQNEIAKRLGIARTTYSGYENGSREPDIDMINKIADLHEVTTDWLLGNETDNKRIINDQAKNEAVEIYNRLPQDKKKLIDDMIKALNEERR